MYKSIFAVIAIMLCLVGSAYCDNAPTAEVYAYGNKLSAPFNLVIDHENQALLLNGVQVFPELPTTSYLQSSLQTTDPASLARDKWRENVFDLQRSLEAEGLDIPEITLRMIELLRTAPIASISDDDISDDAFWVQWEGWAKERISVRPNTATNFEVSLSNELARWQQQLENGCIILVETGIRKVIPPNYPYFSEAREEITQLIEGSKLLAKGYRSLYLEDDLILSLRNPRDLTIKEE